VPERESDGGSNGGPQVFGAAAVGALMPLLCAGVGVLAIGKVFLPPRFPRFPLPSQAKYVAFIHSLASMRSSSSLWSRSELSQFWPSELRRVWPWELRRVWPLGCRQATRTVVDDARSRIDIKRRCGQTGFTTPAGFTAQGSLL
jgi:hypothetical protein